MSKKLPDSVALFGAEILGMAKNYKDCSLNEDGLLEDMTSALIEMLRKINLHREKMFCIHCNQQICKCNGNNH